MVTTVSNVRHRFKGRADVNFSTNYLLTGENRTGSYLGQFEGFSQAYAST